MSNVTLGIHLDHYRYKTLLQALRKAKSYNVKHIQVFVGDNHHTTLSKKNQYTKEDFKKIKEFLQKNKMTMNIHGLLSLNFCFPPDSPRFRWGIDNLVHDMKICKEFGKCKGVVIHMGSFQTPSIQISYQDCLQNFVKSLQIVLSKVKRGRVILETSTNRPNTIGGTLESLSELYHAIPVKDRKRIGFCVDTCHIFSAGYPIHTPHGMKQYFEDFDKLIGLKNIDLIHLNDSQTPFASQKDRHETIGKGYIFNQKMGGDPESLLYLFTLKKPLVLETNPLFFKNELSYLKKMSKKVGGSKDKKERVMEIFSTILSFHKTLGKKGDIQTKFRIQSYERALQSLQKVKKIEKIEDVVGVEGIGKGFQEKIQTILDTDTLDLYEEVKKNPEYQAIYLFEGIWGIGVEKARDLVLENHLYTIEDLRGAVKRGEVILNEQQLKGFEYYEELKERIPRKEIQQFTSYLKKKMKKFGIKIENGGSYRLGKKDSGDIDLIFYKKNIKDHTPYAKNELMENIVDELKREGIIQYIFNKGSSKVISVIKEPKTGKIRQMDIILIDEKELPWYLLYFGSDKQFSKKIRREAIEKGYRLSEQGLFNRKSGKRIKFEPKTEKNIFNFLQIEYIKPKNRI